MGPAQWASLGFLGIVASGAAYFAWFRIVGLLPASISGISSLVVPCIGLSSSAWLAHEQIHPQDLAAMGLILTALACVLVERVRLSFPSFPRNPRIKSEKESRAGAANDYPRPPLSRG